jgi:hypothetical protein
MKRIISVISFVIIVCATSYCQVGTPCYKLGGLKYVEGSFSYTWNPGPTDNGIAYKSVFSWKFSTYMGSEFINSVQTTIIGKVLYLDGKTYTEQELGKEVFSKIRVIDKSNNSFNQEGSIQLDLYSNQKYLTTITLEKLEICNGSSLYKMSKYFNSQQDVCQIVIDGFVLTNPRVSNISFEGLNDARNAVNQLEIDKVYNSKIKEADALFLQNKHNEAKAVYKEASDLKYNEEYPKRKIEQINEILKNIELQKENKKQEEIRKQRNADSITAINKASQIQASENQKERVKQIEADIDKQITQQQEEERQRQLNYEKERQRQKQISKENNEKTVESNKQMEKNVNQAMDDFSQTLWDNAKAEKNYNNYKSSIREYTSLSESQDPDAIIREYEAKMTQIEIAHKKYKAQKMASLEKEIAKMKSSGSVTDNAAANIGGYFATQSIQNQINEAQAKAENELKLEKQKSFDEIKENLMAKYEKQKNAYNRIAATKFSVEEEENVLKMANFFQCNIDCLNRTFNYGNTNWIKSNCVKPKLLNFSSPKNITSNDLYQVAKRKAQKSDAEFQKAAMDYINMAIESDSNVADYYYFKSTLLKNKEEKITFLNKTLAINPNHTAASDASDWFKAKDAMLMQQFRDYITKYPNGKYKSNASAEINFLSNIASINNYLDVKNYDDAIILYNIVKDNTSFKRTYIPKISELESADDEKNYKIAFDKDVKGVKYSERKSLYVNYLSKFPNGVHRADVEDRVRIIDMRLTGNYGYIFFTPNITGFSNLKDYDYYKYEHTWEISTNSYYGKQSYTESGLTDFSKSGGYLINAINIRIGQNIFLYKKPKSMLPRFDLEIQAQWESRGIRKFSNSTD